MTMRAIDAQHMIARSTDFIRESSAIQKQPEINQAHLAANARLHDTKQQQQVPDLVEGTPINLSPDDREQGGMGEAEKREKKAHADEDESEEPGTVVPAAKHIIDITI